MVEIIEDFNMEDQDGAFEGSESQIEDVYHKAGEGLLNFLHRCKTEDSEVMLYPRCSVVFNKRAAKKVENSQQEKRKVF